MTGRSAARSIAGTADSSASVYGCFGECSTSSTVPYSTMRPRYITATSWARYSTTEMLWVMNR